MTDEKERAARVRKLLCEVFMNANSEMAGADGLREEFSAAEAEKIVAGLLYHAPDHILHAARLQYDYVPPAARPSASDEAKR